LLAEVVFDAVAKKKFIAENFFVRGKDWLPGDEVVAALSGHTWSGSGFGGSHCLPIGRKKQ